MINFRRIDRKLKEAFGLVAGALAAAGYPDRVATAFELLDHGEPGVAMEMMCSNLHEFDCPVPTAAYKLFAEVGVIMDIDKSYWEDLEPLLVP